MKVKILFNLVLKRRPGTCNFGHQPTNVRGAAALFLDMLVGEELVGGQVDGRDGAAGRRGRRKKALRAPSTGWTGRSLKMIKKKSLEFNEEEIRACMSLPAGKKLRHLKAMNSFLLF